MKSTLLMISDYAQWQDMTSDEAACHVHFHHGSPGVQYGPVTAAPERLAAFWVIDVADMDAAVE